MATKPTKHDTMAKFKQQDIKKDNTQERKNKLEYRLTEPERTFRERRRR